MAGAIMLFSIYVLFAKRNSETAIGGPWAGGGGGALYFLQCRVA
jgi:hypothetical protein